MCWFVFVDGAPPSKQKYFLYDFYQHYLYQSLYLCKNHICISFEFVFVFVYTQELAGEEWVVLGVRSLFCQAPSNPAVFV